MVVAPGFIDVHSHADEALKDPVAAGMQGFLRQGVTTAVYGVDGEMTPETLRRYIALADAGGSGTNFMAYAGHGAIRRSVMQLDDRVPSGAEMQAMKAMVREAMDLGAIGLSSGLMYLPGRFADRQEVIELARVIVPYGGTYDSHVRDEPGDVITSLQECLDIAYAAGVPAHPAHLKAVSAVNFGKGPDLVRLVEAGIARGQEVTADVYPYDGASTRPVLSLLFPADDAEGQQLRARLDDVLNDRVRAQDVPGLAADLIAYWKGVHEGSDRYLQAVRNTEQPDVKTFSWVQTVGYRSMRIVSSGQPGYAGRMVTDLASELGVAPFELFRRLVVTEGTGAIVTLGAIREEDVRLVLKQPWAMVSSDGEELNPKHPRGRGSFARVLGRYVREWNVLSLEEAVYKMSGLPAKYLRLTDRGVVRDGAVADIVLFDPGVIVDRSTWAEPALFATGVRDVLIGGQFAIRDGELTGARLGRFIRYRGKL
jgi:N-acyl-D-aspartate/D-glutamate deacylase